MKTLKLPSLDVKIDNDTYKILMSVMIGCALIYMENYRSEIEELATTNLNEINLVLKEVDDCRKIRSGNFFTEYGCGDKRLMVYKYDKGDIHRKGLQLKNSNGLTHTVVFYQDPETKEYGNFVTTVNWEGQKTISRNTDMLYMGLSHHPKSFGEKADQLYEEVSLGLGRE